MPSVAATVQSPAYGIVREAERALEGWAEWSKEIVPWIVDKMAVPGRNPVAAICQAEHVLD